MSIYYLYGFIHVAFVLWQIIACPYEHLPVDKEEAVAWVKKNISLMVLSLLGTVYIIMGLFGPIWLLFLLIIINRIIYFITPMPDGINFLGEIILVLYILITVIYF